MKQSVQKKKWISPKNIYRTRWTTHLGRGVSATSKKSIKVSPLQVLYRFNEGMVYKTEGKYYLLTEKIFCSYPFLLVFEISCKGKGASVESTRFHSVPEELLKSIAPACEKFASTVKVPESIHNLEIDITTSLNQSVKLPNGIILTKSIIKLGKIGEISCDCDVDGPCGYCCDTCDCDTCKLDDILINPIEVVI